MKRRPASAFWSGIAFLAAIWFGACVSLAEEPVKPAQLHISGYGVLGELRLKKMLRVLQTGTAKPEFFDANYIEDAALLLASRLKQDGYLHPVITAQLTLADRRKMSWLWDEAMEEPLARPLTVRVAKFEIKKGVQYYYEGLEFSGLHAFAEKKARSYFFETGGLLSFKRNRIYSPERLKRSLANLTAELQRMGFQNVAVSAEAVHVDDKTGKVKIRIQVTEGLRFMVHSVRQEVFRGSDIEPVQTRTNWPGKPYSKDWEQDFAQSIRTNYYQRGYPDAAVDLQTIAQTPGTNEMQLDVRAVVKTGPRVRVGDVSFVGNQRTKESVLERRVPLHEGDWLDRLKAEEGRYRLSRLGIFDSVNLKYEGVDEQTRDITYQLHEGKQIEVSLLFGYGSYELLRGGVQLDQYNVFGRAHHQRLKLTQSFKASSADYTYTMPEFFGESVDVFATASGLRREEVSFMRQEYGAGAGVRKYFRNANTDVSARYSYQILEATEVDADVAQAGPQNSRAAAIITDINHDRRDNPLYPHRGYKIFTTVELASDYLGGDVDYQRLDFFASLHVPLSGSQWLHLGLSHGVASTLGSTRDDLPFNRRFFPGGESTIRGYQEGEAAPRDADGNIVGAETYLLGNAEFEQGLTPKWSVVVFVDAVGFARELKNYPADETLVSAGGGVRWKTVIGPVRLEYGRNLNPRSRDPSGTLHFSLGFPF